MRAEAGIGPIGGVYTALGYHSATVASREGRPATHGSHKQHTRVHRPQLIAQSREFRRDNPVYQGTLARTRQFLVGKGFKLQLTPAEGTPNADAMAAWCANVEREWRKWWKRPGVRQILSGPRFEGLVADELLTCGDTLVVKSGKAPNERLQLIEAEQLKGPKADDDGIELDKYGKPKAFYVCEYDKNGQTDPRKAKEYRPEEVLFVCSDPERASSTRAVPPLQASFPNLHRLNDVANAEAIAWQMQARIALLITREDGAPIAGSVSRSDPTSNDTDGELDGGRITDVDYAMFFHGKPGETVTGMKRTAPSKDFDASFRALARLTGLPINFPLEFILLDFSEDNYSQTRALVALFSEWLLSKQEGLADQFHSPVFEWWLAGRILAKLIDPPPGEYELSWIYPVFPGIDLESEANAYLQLIRMGVMPWSAAVKAQGGDPDQVRRQKILDVIAAMEAADEVEEKGGERPPWQSFCGELAESAVAPEPPRRKEEDEQKDDPPPPPPAEEDDEDEDEDEEDDDA